MNLAQPVLIAEDRSLRIDPDKTVAVQWIDIDLCVLGNRDPMAPEAVAEKWRRLLQLGDAAPWPPLVGEWRGDGRFVVLDGRHDMAAALMRGRREALVCWVVPRAPSPAATASPWNSQNTG